MFHWSGVTRNLIMQNSSPIRKHGGNLGMTTWSYVVGNDGVKTIEPALAFYLNSPPNSRCRWSTGNGHCPPRHIINDHGSENGMPPRELVDWNDDIVQSKVEQYRDQYWEELKYLVRPNTFEDLYELFDSFTLWRDGAYNLWKLVNALVTLAHDQFPCVLQDWKNFIEEVVHETFRPVTRSRLLRHNENNNSDNMQVLHNQHILAEWDGTVDPLVLLQHTSFPTCNLPLMNVQQHGLLRELLICEHIGLTGTKSPIPPYYNYPRPVVHAGPDPATDLDDNQLQHGSIESMVRAEPCRLSMPTTAVNSTVKSTKSAMPLVVVGSNDHDGQLKTQVHDMPTLSKKTAASITVIQSPDNLLSSPAPLSSIPEESTCTKSTCTKYQDAQCVAATDTAFSPSESGLSSHEIMNVAPEGLIQDSIPPVDIPAETKPTHGQMPAPWTIARDETLTVETNATEAKAAVPKITPKVAKPPPHCPIPDRKDSNGSTDELFFPNVSTKGLHVGRKRSIASAPDQDTNSMLTLAEQKAPAASETPPIRQAHCDQQQPNLHPVSGASIANDPANQSFLRLPVPRLNQGRQQPEPRDYQTQPILHYNRHSGRSTPQSSRIVPRLSSSNGKLRGQALSSQSHPSTHADSNGTFTPSPPSMRLGPNPQYGIPLPPSVSMPPGPPMGAPINAQIRPPVGLPFQHQMPLHMNQHFSPPGSLVNASPLLDRKSHFPGGHQAVGYIHHLRQHDGSGEQDDSGYSSNGYRINNNDGLNSQYNGRRRDSIQSNGSRKDHMQPISAGANSISRQPGAGLLGRRPASVARPDQSRVRLVSSNCQNDTRVASDELYSAQFIECSCDRCQENSRSIFVRMRNQGNTSDKAVQNAILKHFAQFNPVNARIRRTQRGTTCFVQFRNDLDIARIVHWSCNPENQSAPGVSDRIHTWYPLFSKHYVPEQRGRIQDRYHPHSLTDHNRRDSNPFRNQQPKDTSETPPGYNSLNSMRIPYNDPNFNGSLSAPGFPPSNGIFYQQIHPHNQHRLLYNPKASQHRDLELKNARQTTPNTDQKLYTKTGYSQDVRRSRLLSEGPWRQTQAKPASEEVVMEEDDDTMVAVKGKASASSVEKAKISHPAEEFSAHQAISLDRLRNDSLEVDTELQDTTEAGKLQTEWPQRSRLQKEQHRTEKPNKKKLQTETSKKERTPIDDSKIAPGKNSDNNATSPIGAASGTSSPSQRNNASAVETGVKSVTSSYSTKTETTKPVQQKPIAIGESYVTDGRGQESIASSRTMTPQTARSTEEEIATHHKQSPVERSSTNEKQTGFDESIETMGVDAANNEKPTGGYSMTTSQLSSAVEDFSYSTETVIRHKPGRPSLPLQWADAEAGEEGRTGAQSPLAGVQTGSTSLNRLTDVNRRMDTVRVQPIARISVQEMAQAIMTTSFIGAFGGALVTEEATPSSASSVSNNAKTNDENLVNFDSKFAVTTEQKSLPPRLRNKNKSKKKKSQGARSHLTLRSEKPIDTQSQGPSPDLEKSLSAAASDDTWHDHPEKATNAKFRSDTTGGSLRMPKSRSPKKRNQKRAPQITAKSKSSTMGEVPSLTSVFEPLTKEVTDVPAETNAFADQKRVVDETRKPEPSTSSLKLSKSTDYRVALPRVALPLPQVARSTKTDGSWAFVAKSAVSYAPKSNKIDNNDPFTVEKGQVALGDFIKAQNLKSPQTAEEKKENESVSHDKASPTPSPEKRSRRQNATTMSQLNAAVRSFNPMASATTSFPPIKQRLNPNAATFSLTSSASQSVVSAHAPRCDQSGGHVSEMKIEKPIVADGQMPIPGSSSGKKHHEKNPSFPGHTASTEKRFITPAEQVLNATKVVQPPPPGKESKRVGAMPDRFRSAGEGATLAINAHQATSDNLVAELKKTTEIIQTTEQAEDAMKALEKKSQIAGNANTKPRSTTHKITDENHPASGSKTLNTELFPTLAQAATVGSNKKRRDTSTIKAGLPTSGITAHISDTIVGSDNQETHQSGVKVKKTITQRPYSGPATVVENVQEPRVVQRQTDVQGSGLKQEGEKDVWQTVAPKQKNTGGASKGHHGGRPGKYGSVRGGRGGRGGRDGATEERKGG